MDTNALSLETYPQQQPQFGVYPQQQSPQPTKTSQNFVYEPTTPTSPTLPQVVVFHSMTISVPEIDYLISDSSFL